MGLKKELVMHGEDLQNFDVVAGEGIKDSEEEIWFETASHPFESNNNDENKDANMSNENDFLDVDVSDPSSLFYADFPPLPEFPCMSSSSSSSSTPVATVAPKPLGVCSTATTSSSASTASSGAASWAVLKSDADQDPEPVTDHDLVQRVEEREILMDDVDHCMDMMQNFGCIDMLENTDICWDPSPLFEDNNGDENECSQYQFLQPEEVLVNRQIVDEDEEERVFEHGVVSGGMGGQNSGEPGSSTDDLALVFFEWLKSNKEAISAEDLRNIKIKKSTIENAAKRLGGGKEGMKQLLKLILQWVQNHHLQNKKMMMSGEDNEFHAVNTDHKNENATTSDTSAANPSCAPESQCFRLTTWLPAPPPPQSYVSESPVMVPMTAPPPPPGFPPTIGYMGGDPYGGGNPTAAYPPMPPSDYHTWGPTPMQYGMSPHYGGYPDAAAPFGGYPNPPPYPGFYYHPGPTEGLVRLGSSATKEARKKRMARQRSQMAEQQHAAAVVGNGNCGVVAPHGNWVYWPPPPPPQVVAPQQVNHPGPMVGQMMPPQPPIERAANGYQKQVGIEKKQGWKTEKNLRFLLQKVLKQSDVGNLGRIVLPKKEAETHLPELEARDGIPIAMEDIGTSRVWNMRYRFWPNNKSRMYLLENTGDFVRSNGLQEGDFIVIYSDVKCGKYMIRGVKVRPQQQSAKPELTNKKSNKTQKTEPTSSPAGNGPSSSPTVTQS
uniref:TF-B3 domain-containing protein n=1 Tax=Chenopodium quinoa TaxID=63459 RepID=A0A803LAK5_CHEQI